MYFIDWLCFMIDTCQGTQSVLPAKKSSKKKNKLKNIIDNAHYSTPGPPNMAPITRHIRLVTENPIHVHSHSFLKVKIKLATC